MRTTKIIIIGLFLIIGLISFGQDPSFSQYYFNQTYFSPALAGIHGGSSVNLTYRRQWVNMPGKFETIFFNFDTDISSAKGLGGVGLTIYKDVEGEGYLTTLGASLLLNSRIRIAETGFLQVGASISVYNKTIDFSKFTFGDQIDPVYGVQPIESTFSHPKEQNNIFPDLGIGMVYAFGKGPKKRLTFNNYNAKIGIAIHHINEPNQSFLDQKSKLPMKLVLHANMNIAMNNQASIIFSPCIVFEYQEAFKQNNYDMKTMYGGFNLLYTNFFLGSWIRLFNNSDAMIFNVGFISGNEDKYSNKFKVYYSYDMTISGLSTSTTGGSHEIALVYFFHDKINIKRGKRVLSPLECPDP